MTLAVPVIDLRLAATTQGRREVAHQIDDALHRVGFMAVVGHGVDPALVDTMFRLVNEFFDQPREVKMRVAPPSPRMARGYAFFGAAAQGHANGAETKPDLSESFNAGIDPIPDTAYYRQHALLYPPSLWPAQPSELAKVWGQYLGEMQALAALILELMASALGLASDHFSPLIDRPMASMTANHYPALDHDPEPNQFRGGAHTDYGTITLLATDGVPGLQLRDEAGEWAPVQPVPGAFHVNTGDMLSYWSGGHWLSTWHRVMAPNPAPPHPARTSLAYFHSPNADALIEPLPGRQLGEGSIEPVLASTYLQAKIDRYYAIRVAAEASSS